MWFNNETKISLLLNDFRIENKLINLFGVDNLYIPYKFFLNPNYFDFVKTLSQTYKTYIYMPNIIRDNLGKNVFDIEQKKDWSKMTSLYIDFFINLRCLAYLLV